MLKQADIVVHPIVLLSILDHFERSDTKRVAGIILGKNDTFQDISNCYAVPFKEDDEQKMWFFDTSFQQNMYALLKKINSNEKILGWYHSGGVLQKSDYEITLSMSKFVTNPLLLVVDVHSNNTNFPIMVFKLNENRLVFVNSCIEAEEAEEVGVEHLIRDIKHDNHDKGKSLKESLVSYKHNIEKITKYLDNVLSGKIKKNYQILACLQEILNSAPKLGNEHNDNNIECYYSELTKSVVALYDLELNKEDRAV